MADLNDRTGNVNLWNDEFTFPVDVTDEQGKKRLNTASSIIQNGVVSSGNSSTANLNAAAIFTGTGELILNVESIQVSFKATQNCTIQVQQSIDNTNWDHAYSYSVVANMGDSRAIGAGASYMRIVVTNTGGSATTFLRLQTILTPITATLPRNLILDQDGQQRLAVDAKVTSLPASNAVDDGLAWSNVIDALTLTAGEKPFYLLRNPSGSGKKLRIVDMAYSSDATFSIWRFYRNPTITTVGTIIPSVNFLVTGGSPSALAYHSSTISALGTLIRVEYTTGRNANAVNPAILRSLEANEDFLITVDPQNNTKHYLTAGFSEEII
jgi:hypothetical protein